MQSDKISQLCASGKWKTESGKLDGIAFHT